ncbi:DUF1700 domain-containing protein [Anaerosporobacter sp.]|uniref:DUF1700 domain-containing protein n=1 Tax=Anaerosporobacter sp. TaxID=1872529 RepID=UPI00286EEFE2|nr:DUF1700 domain-containing protein [Anaerosporobacter sp.]
MDKLMNEYLEKVDRHLKSMPASERVDIVKEIKSSMLELEANGLSSEEVINRLGDAKSLAKAYLGESITENTSFSLKKFGAVVRFYSYVSIGGMFILPCLSITAVTCMLCAILCPISGVIKLIAFSMGIEIPQIQFEMGSFSAGAVPYFFISIAMGIILFCLGHKLWKLTIKFIKSVSKQRGNLNIG